MKLRTATLVACGVLSLTACTGVADEVEEASSSVLHSASTSDSTQINDAKSAGSILETGFGQQENLVRAIAIVQNTSDAIGQTVTVQFNVKDAAGKVLGSESQVQHFSHAGEKIPVGVRVDLSKGKVAASVDARLLVEDNGTSPSEPLPKIQTGPIKLAKLGHGLNEWHASIWVTNPADYLKSPHVEVACYNKAKKIMGGNDSYPQLLPPGEAVVEVNLITSGTPASCIAYVYPRPS